MGLILGSYRLPVARGVALFLAVFTLVNIAGAHLSRGFDANAWWIDLGFLPRLAGSISLTVASAALLCFAVGFPDHWLVRRVIWLAVAALTAAVFWNIVAFYGLWLIGRIHPGVPIPLSLVISLTLGFILRSSARPWKLATRGQRIALWVTFAASFFLFPLAQMYCFGKTDYRRDADVIVVFGARAYADGSASQALADRVRTAVELYNQKHAKLLILSGGPGDGAVSEPQAMRKLAESLGVPAAALLLDEAGVNTDQSVAHTVQLIRERHMTRVLAVSHFYHLPRVKMAYARALSGDKPVVEVFTVPAEESAPLTRMPWYMMREIAALWTYYLRPLTSHG